MDGQNNTKSIKIVIIIIVKKLNEIIHMNTFAEQSKHRIMYMITTSEILCIPKIARI